MKSAPKKRGGAWGYTAQDVSGELHALTVQWWYNWGNGIPDAAAEATTAVSLAAHTEQAEMQDRMQRTTW